jgi:hypothetical protein
VTESVTAATSLPKLWLSVMVPPVATFAPSTMFFRAVPPPVSSTLTIWPSMGAFLGASVQSTFQPPFCRQSVLPESSV